MAKVFKVGKYYHFRSLVNGRDKWQSTHQTNRDKAQDVADKHNDAQKGRGNVEEFFKALMQRIGTLPETERAETRQKLARRLMMMQQHTLALADAWQVWCDSPMKGNPGADTTERYAGHWQRFRAWATKPDRKLEYLHAVTTNHADEYARDLWREKVAPRTFNGHIVFLRGMFATLKKAASLTENPWAEIKSMEKRTQGRVNFTPDELAIIISKADGFIRYAVGLAIFTGLRLGDVMTLRWADIHGDKIEIIPSKTARKGKTITLPVHPVLALLLAERRKQAPGDYVFPVEREEYLREPTLITNQFQKFLTDTCGIVTTEAKGEHRQRAIVRKGFHSLRHSFVSLCAINGVPQVVIQELVGHGSPAMTALYSHADFAQKKSAIALLPTMDFESRETQSHDTAKPDSAAITPRRHP